jgi:dienelactone hydrolase
LALGCAVTSVALRAAFALPSPTGPFAVGTTQLSFERPEEAGEAGPGRFDVQVWYPGVSSHDRAPYGMGAPGMKRWMYHCLVRTHAARNVALAPANGRFPVLIYVAGWGDQSTGNTVLAEDLASHGFVVFGLGDVAFDSPPLERLAAAPDFTSQRGYESTLRLGHEKLQYAARRVSRLLDGIEVLERQSDTRFAHRLDLQRVGIVGFSLGGAVALEVCRHDARFKAAMNLDGWLFDAAENYRGGIPYFLVSDRDPPPGPGDLDSADPVHRYSSRLTAFDEEQQDSVLRRGGYRLQISGADHYSFTDVPLYAPLHRLRGHGNAERLGFAVREYAVAFFQETLRGVPSPLLVPGERSNPAMTLASWPLESGRHLP